MALKRKIWLNGEIVDNDKAFVPVLSPTSQFGLNVFEGIRCYYNDEAKKTYVFRIKEHLDRLEKSAQIIRLNLPYTKEQCFKASQDIIKANDYKCDVALRMTVFATGEGTWSTIGETGMFVAPIPKERTMDKDQSLLKIKISSWERISEKNLTPKAKLGANYMNSRMAQLEALDLGFDTAVLPNRYGNISEAVGSCIFMVKGNELITPPLSADILDSITRDTVMELAKYIPNLKLVVRDFTREELLTADEAFLCGSAMEIRGICQVDDAKINGYEITNKLKELYLKAVMGEINKDWVTEI